MSRMDEFVGELERIINAHNMESESDTPDFILAKYLLNCLVSFEAATKERDIYYSISTNGITAIVTGPAVEISELKG